MVSPIAAAKSLFYFCFSGLKLFKLIASRPGPTGSDIGPTGPSEYCLH